MNMGNIKSLFELAKNASSVQVIILVFLVLPFVIEKWLSVFDSFPGLVTQKGSALSIIIIAFSVLILVAINKDKKLGKLQLAKNQILSHLKSNDFKTMTLVKVRDKFNKEYSDDFLIEVINTFPNELRIATMYKEDSSNEKTELRAVGRV
jgi:hypothetical protein